ncbi:MAG: adenylate cyclase, partial [Gammaproteobacteria bacterium]|nr:adenylate cyclase [Gammaproteobacteria bacterium]
LMQFFFEDSGDDYNLYILDEANRVEVYRQVAGSKDELVQSINRFYTSDQQVAGQSHFAHFNLPQYYEIVAEEGQHRVLPYRTVKEDRDDPRPCPAG